MIVYHRTAHAEEILREGFRDAILANGNGEGVWFSATPVEMHEGAKGETVLSLEIPDDVLAPHEWADEESDEGEKTYREFHCPAELVNRFGPPEIHSDDWQGVTEARLLGKIAALEKVGNVKEAKRLRERMPFLKKHGLLAIEYQ